MIFVFYRIYLRCPQWSSLLATCSLRQILVLCSAFLMLIVLVILFISSKLSDHSDSRDEKVHHFLPTVNYGKKDIDLEYFNYGPNVRYGIVLDCGSSGTRVYVYIWPPHSGNPKDLLSIQQLHDHNNLPVVKKVEPGTYFVYFL